MWTQPILTTNGTIGTSEFAVASGGGADSDAYKAFDNSDSSYVNKMNSGAWLKFFSQTWLVISDIVITSKGSLPSQGIFQVSCDNGVTWQQCGSWQDSDALGESAHVVIDSGSVTGQFFRFVSQGKSLAKPNNNADFCNVIITADIADELPLSLIVDVERNVRQSRTPVAKYLSFTGNSGCYGELPLDVLAGAKTFTWEFKLVTTATRSGNDYLCPTICGRTGDREIGLYTSAGKLGFWANPAGTRTILSDAVINDGAIHKVAVVSADGAIDLYCDGELVAHTDNVNVQISSSNRLYLAWNSYSNTSLMQMDLYEARFWSIARSEIFADIDGTEDGLQAWYWPSEDGLKDYSGNARHATLYGSPAYTYIETLPLSLDFDVERKLIAPPFRYTNAGTADTLSVTGTTLTGLPETKSVTGTAFYQTSREKCFDIPATPEIWIKFDVYFNGSARWRAYNGGTNGTTGITAQTNGDLSFFANDSNVQQFSDVCKKNQLQTVLLHMTAGSSDGVIEAWIDGEKIYTYTGDVNHGEDFADIYLQSDGAGTFFSNVIISNVEVGLGDGYQIFSADVERKVKNFVEETFDVHITAPIVVPLIGEHFNHYVRNITVYRGSPQKIILPKKGDVWIAGTVDDTEIFTADGQSFYLSDPNIHFVDVDEIFIGDNYYGDNFAIFDEILISDGDGNTRQIFSADIERTLIKTSENIFDVKFVDVVPVEFTADVSRNILTVLHYFETDNSEYLSGGASAVTLPTQEFIPPLPETGLQSIEITLQEQQLTDQVKVVGVIPFDILYPVRGQYLDYVYDMRVEKVQQHGILYSADCCVDIDELLYTPLNYELASTECVVWHVSESNVSEIFFVYPEASKHIERIAEAMGLEPVMQFDDFYSTVEVGEQKEDGATYADLIRDIFGWSARVPTQLINVFIREGKLFVIQRGYERNVIDLTNAERTLPVVNRSLVRLFWQRQKLTRTLTGQKSSARKGYDKNGGDDGGGGSGSGSEDASWLSVGRVVTQDSHGITVTTYTYTRDGVLLKTVADFTSSEDREKNCVTTTTNSYGSDGLLDNTVVEVSYPYDNTENTKTVTTYGYLTLGNGKKFLSTEQITEYSWTNNHWELDDQRTTTKSPTGRGQGATADSHGNSSSGKNTGDDRVTPYMESQAKESIPDTGESETTNLEGLSLIDTSFPIQDIDDGNYSNLPWDKWQEGKVQISIDGKLVASNLGTDIDGSKGHGRLVELTAEMKRLNRMTQETVTFALYNFPHLIDFNDRIVLEGNEYFLARNIAKTTPRLYNEQNLTLVRWF